MLRIIRQDLSGDKFKRITKSDAHFRNWVYIVTGCEKRYDRSSGAAGLLAAFPGLLAYSSINCAVSPVTARPYVTLNVSFLDGGHKGNRKSLTILAGANVMSLLSYINGLTLR